MFIVIWKIVLNTIHCYINYNLVLFTDIIKNTSIQHGKLFLRLELTLNVSSGLSCDKYNQILNKKECLIFNKLSDPEYIAEVEKIGRCMLREICVYCMVLHEKLCNSS